MAEGHVFIEDARGKRLADVNPNFTKPMPLALLGSPPFFIRGKTHEAKIVKPRKTTATSQLVFVPLSQRARGSVAESFQRELFSTPFSPSFYQGMMAMKAQILQEGPAAQTTPNLNLVEHANVTSSLTPWFWGSVATTGFSAAVTGALAYWAKTTHDQYNQSSTPAEAIALEDKSRRLSLYTNVALAVTGTGFLTSFILYLVDD